MDILELIKSCGVSIPDDKVEDFNKSFRTNYKAAAEVKKLRDDLTEAQGKLSSQADFEGKFNTLQKKYTDDLAEAQAKLSGFEFNTKLEKALGGIEFSSTRVRDSIISEIKNKNMKVGTDGNIEGLTDYLKEVYKAEPSSFKSVDDGIHTWAGGSGSGGSGGADKPKSNPFGKLY